MSARANRTATALALLLSAAAGSAAAQSSGGPYAIPRQSIDAGAVRAESATFRVEGSIGQPDAGPSMQSTNYSLRGGFMVRELPATGESVFADGFE